MSTSSPQRLIDWTGERCVPWAPDYQMLYEHLHRYHFAARYCAGRRVLDLACGEGYGSAILAAVAEHVVAVDIDQPTIEHARATYANDNLEFIESSITDARAFADGPFDVVVCLEAIEHIKEHEALVAAIKGALTPSGIAVISTPDREIYSEESDYHNPFHVRELSRDEFCQLLSGTFKHVSVLAQQSVVGSRIDSLSDAKGDPEEVFYVAQDDDAWVLRGPQPVPYLLAVASDLDEMVPESSTLIDLEMQALRDPLGRLAEVTAEREQLRALVGGTTAELHPQIESMVRELEQLHEDRSRLEAQHYAHDAQIGALEDSIKELVQRASEAQLAHAEAYAELEVANAVLQVQLHTERASVVQLATAVEAMRSSRGWRIMEALRGIRANGRSLATLVFPRSRSGDDTPQTSE